MSNTSHAPMLRTGARRRITIVLLLLLVAGGIGVGVGIVNGKIPNPLDKLSAPPVEQTQAEAPRDRSVKVVKPKKAASVPIAIEQMAMVEPYYRADLRARASGIVKRVHRDIGDRVKAGELLVEIEVPESEQEVARAEAMILQREQELKVSKAKLKDAQAGSLVAAATVKQRLADVDAAVATRDLKKRKFERLRELASKGSVVGSVVDEEERDYLSSEAAVISSNANVEKARADLTEAESKVEAAAADIDLKNATIVVGRKELERARAIADYARVLAPFDGVVIRRTVDPGSFVQNSTTGSTEALISIARVDLVTVAARFPDSAAPHVTIGTPATVMIDDLPDVTISAKVTRFAPSVQNADRTMRVEIDLFNGDDDELVRLKAAYDAGGPNRPTKGIGDPFPVRAFAEGSPKTRRLLPGMTATMKLTVGGYGESFVVPSTAVYSRSGANYVLVVENGKTRQVPVRVQVTDGRTSRIAFVTKRRDSSGNMVDVLSDVNGSEQIVVARQLEIGDGATVQTALSDW